MRIFSDTETYNETPIGHGTYAYAYSPTAEVMLYGVAVEDGPVFVFDLTDMDNWSAELWENWEWVKAALVNPDNELIWQNSIFDRNMVLAVLGIEMPQASIHDTMIRALCHGLPGGLDKLCGVLNIDDDKAKSKDGKALIQLFCKPRPKNMKLRRATRETHPEEWQRFINYTRLDIEAMRAIYYKLPVWNYRDRELELWHLDQRINDRGFRVDVELAHAAVDAALRTQADLAEETQVLTYGEVESATKRDKLLKHILEYYDVDLPDMKADTLERRLNDSDLPDGVRQLIAIRLAATTVSTKKYKTLLNTVSADGRLRGTMLFSGAARTARWSHKLFQPGNMPRPDMPYKEIEFGIEAIKAGCPERFYDNVMRLLSNVIRGCIISSEGKLLVVSDLANIEGRAAAWLAGELWKLAAFRAYDAKTGHDLYILSYARAFNVAPESIDKKTIEGYFKRQIGKVMELFLQYEGGVGAFLTGAATYGIDLDAMAEAAYPQIPANIIKEAEHAWEWAVKKKKTFDLEKKVYIVCDALKRMWREAHPEITSHWPEIENACKAAVISKGKTFIARHLKIRCDGAWLRIRLPSGRYLCYSSPRVDKDKLSYMGMSTYSRQWKRIKTYGGKLFENICQATARDVMAHNMPEIEYCGYEIVLTVHDEVVTEAPDNGEYSHEELSHILATNPPWAEDLPLAAGGFQGIRYRKDD